VPIHQLVTPLEDSREVAYAPSVFLDRLLCRAQAVFFFLAHVAISALQATLDVGYRYKHGCILAPPGEYDEMISVAAAMRAVATISVYTWFSSGTQAGGNCDLCLFSTNSLRRSWCCRPIAHHNKTRGHVVILEKLRPALRRLTHQ